MPNEVEIIQVDMKTNYQSDFDNLHSELRDSIHAYNRRGYEVQSITPITSGEYSDYEKTSYGFGYTSGLVVVYRKINFNPDED